MIQVYKTTRFLISIIFGIFAFYCCNSVSPEIKKEIQLIEIDKSAKEVYLQIKLDTGYSSKKVQLYKNGQEYLQYDAANKDTVITVEALEANTSYSFQCKLVENEDKVLVSNEITTTTLGITSHEFEWKFFSFSAYSTNLLNDVCVVSEKDIWTVGKVALLDSNGEEIHKKYNAFNWDGEKWNEKRMEVYINYNDVGYTTSASDGNAIFEAEDETLVFLSSGGGVSIKKDEKWQYITVPKGIEQPYSSRYAFAMDQTEMYFGNIKGEIFACKDDNWQKVQSLLERITKFYGYYCEVSSCYRFLLSNGYEAYEMNSSIQFSKIEWENGEMIIGFWTNKGYPFYCCGSGIFKKTSKDWEKVVGLEDYPIANIEGTALNNILAVSGLGRIIHYNGETWEENDVLREKNILVNGISFKNGIAAICGQYGNNSFVAIGKQKI